VFFGKCQTRKQKTNNKDVLFHGKSLKNSYIYYFTIIIKMYC